MRAITLVALAALAFVACRTASTERVLYQWSDAEGNVRYTTLPETVPGASRDSLNQVQPGRSAQENAALMPGSITEPRPPESPREWLAGQQPPEETDAGAAASAAEVAEEAAVPTTPEEIAAIDARIRALEQQITEEEVSLAQRMGEPESEDGNPVDEAAVREASDHLPQLQAELEELRSRRQLMKPAPNEH
ncbi:MAG TPA: hypothetical protein VFY49_14805 [Myxococcota bacterium]|nr:hypothetical protein [Myxococcota bacterium]